MINKALNIPVLKIDATVIDNVNQFNFLGIIIDNINWKKHRKNCPGAINEFSSYKREQ